MKRLVLFVLCVAMLVGLCPNASDASATVASDNWIDYAVEVSPTVDNVFEIYTAEQLAWIANKCNATVSSATFSGYTVKLMNDIDLYGKEWTPIGNTNFSGVFDGQGHTIDKLTISGSQYYAGLFGYAVDAIVKNVNLKDIYIDISQSIFSVAGGICAFGENVTIENCFTTGKISTLSSDSDAGGICGNNFRGGSLTIINCGNGADVSATSYSATSNVGGLLGYSSGSVTICNSYNYGYIFTIFLPASSRSYVGGLCGYISGRTTITNCYNLGDSFSYSAATDSNSNHYSYSGGICALASGGYITNCYNSGTINSQSVSTRILTTSYSYSGGLVGIILDDLIISDCYNIGAIVAHSSATSSYSNTHVSAGGISGQNGSFNPGTIKRCYNVGNIAVSAHPMSSVYVGGICGFSSLYDDQFESCFWNIEGSQKRNDFEIINEDKRGVGFGIDSTLPIITSHMKQQASYVGWDFSSTWAIDPLINLGFPFIKGLYTEATPSYNIIGQIYSYNPQSMTSIILYDAYMSSIIDLMTIEALTAGSDQITQSFTLADVPVGTYDLVVTKGGHLNYTIIGIVVEDKDIDLSSDTTKPYSTIVLLAGDVDGNGLVSTPDLTLLLNCFGKAPTVQYPFADINGDSIVSTPDLTILLNNFGRKNENCVVPY